MPASNDTITPFSNISVSDTVLGNTETVTVTLSGSGEPPIVGSLSDPDLARLPTLPLGTQRPIRSLRRRPTTGSPTPATTILDRLVYIPPPVLAGQQVYVNTTVNVNGVYDNPYGYNLIYTPNPPSVSIETAGAPTITYTVANQPIVSGDTIDPFGAVEINDINAWSGNDVITVTVMDGGVATDADGMLSGTGLSKTGTGTYTVGLPYELDQLTFTPTAVASGASTHDGLHDNRQRSADGILRYQYHHIGGNYRPNYDANTATHCWRRGWPDG